MSESSKKLKERFFKNLKEVSLNNKDKLTRTEELKYSLIGLALGLSLLIGVLIYISYL